MCLYLCKIAATEINFIEENFLIYFTVFVTVERKKNDDKYLSSFLIAFLDDVREDENNLGNFTKGFSFLILVYIHFQPSFMSSSSTTFLY